MKAQGLCAVAILAVAQLALVSAMSMPPLTVPSFTPPNTTAIMMGVKNSLRSAAVQAAMESVKYRPMYCPNNKPFVVCHWDACKTKSPCGANQVCVPDFCGRCGAKCIDIQVPIVPLEMPEVPKLLQGRIPPMPTLKAPCGLNQAINVTGTASQAIHKKDLTPVCKDCPAGTVATGHAIACTVCPPGMYGDRATGKCAICAPGTYSRGFGVSECKPCDAGSFAPVPGSVFCVPCPIGFAAAAAGAKTCKFTGFSAKA
ncbi:MAG: hypothetical protein J3K34DRAFT_445148 [Monoraphidium minutum]|nr:MAG: hypothetical protein J3K34DRAFT_445148 [Monoraphidium minutum]